MVHSYTGITAFETCPRRCYHTRIRKDVPDPPGEAALWGTKVHEVLEQRLLTGKPIEGSLAYLDKYAAKIASTPGTLKAEMKFGINKNLQPVDFFAKDVWFRGVFDVVIDAGRVVTILDWKTGRRKPNCDQLEVFAAASVLIYPKAERIRTGFVWLKDAAVDTEQYTADFCKRLWEKIIARTSKIDKALADDKFPPKPSGLCRKWCPVKQCEFHGE